MGETLEATQPTPPTPLGDTATQDAAYQRMRTGWAKALAIRFSETPQNLWRSHVTWDRLAAQTLIPVAVVEQVAVWASLHPDDLQRVAQTAVIEQVRATREATIATHNVGEATARTEGRRVSGRTSYADRTPSASSARPRTLPTDEQSGPPPAQKVDRRIGPRTAPRKPYPPRQPRTTWQQPRQCAYAGCGRTFTPANITNKGQRYCCMSCVALARTHPHPPYPAPKYRVSMTIGAAHASSIVTAPIASSKPTPLPVADAPEDTAETMDKTTGDAHNATETATKDRTDDAPEGDPAELAPAIDDVRGGLVTQRDGGAVDEDRLRYLVACEVERVFDRRLRTAVQQAVHDLFSTLTRSA